MEVPYIAEVLFILSCLVFLVALFLIIPTVLEERRVRKRSGKHVKQWHLPYLRRKRALKKAWRSLIKKGPSLAVYSLTGTL